MSTIKSYIEQNKKRFLEELIELLKIPSVSADQSHKVDILKTAEAMRDALSEAGCKKVEICETPGNPIV